MPRSSRSSGSKKTARCLQSRRERDLTTSAGSNDHCPYARKPVEQEFGILLTRSFRNISELWRKPVMNKVKHKELYKLQLDCAEAEIIGHTTKRPKYARLLIWDSFESLLCDRRNPAVIRRPVSSECDGFSSFSPVLPPVFVSSLLKFQE